MKKNLYCSLALLCAFIVWTLLVTSIDVKAIGPLETSVGFATLNRFIHQLTGVHLSVYIISDILSLIPLLMVAVFGIIGLKQWIKRKRFLSVDRDILFLGGFYIVVFAIYILFEFVVINYRPILIEGILEASYPSSTTMLVICIMGTSMMQFHKRIKNAPLKRGVNVTIFVFSVFMVVGRMISGVHWFTDIVGGALLSAGLVMMYGYLDTLY